MKKNKKLNLVISILVIGIILISVSFQIFHHDNKNNVKITYAGSYHVRISTLGNISYDLILPILLNTSNDGIAKCILDIKNSNNYTVSIINNSHGYGIEIKGYGNIEIFSNDKINYSYPRLSMSLNNTTGIPHPKFWCYLSFSQDSPLNKIIVESSTSKYQNCPGCVTGKSMDIIINYEKSSYLQGWNIVDGFPSIT